MSVKSAIVVPAGLVKDSDESVLLAIRAPAGTVRAIEFPAQLVSATTPETAVFFQAPLAHVVPATAHV